MKIEIVPRTDDGTFDLYERHRSGRLDFLSNHPTMDEARSERNSYKRQMSKGETLAFLQDLKQSLNRV